jgi:hypothetical protein
MSGACITLRHEETRNAYKILVGKSQLLGQFRETGVDERIIL